MSLTFKHCLRNNKIQFYAAIISILFSIIAYSKSDPINYDGMLYLSTANAYLKSGFSAALAIYAWPFYSIVSAWLTKLTSLSLIHSAEILNILFLTLITINFINLIKKLGNNTYSLQIFAAITILAFPTLNHYRDLIIRDFGYWACYLIAINQFINYLHTTRWRYILTWLISIFCATLFRIEGAIILIFAPFALLVWQEKKLSVRLKHIANLYLFPVIIIACYLSWHQLHAPTSNAEIGRTGELLNQLTHGWQLIIDTCQARINNIRQYVLTQESSGDAASWFIFGFSGVFIQTAITTLSILYTLLVVYAFVKRLMPNSTSANIINYFLILNLLIALVFYAERLFLSERYLIAACLTLALWVPFSLQHLYQRWRNHNKQHWLFWLVAIVLLLTTIGSVNSFGYSKAYITAAGVWLKQNTPEQASIYSNNKQVLFYAERTQIDWQKYYDDSNPLNTLQHESWYDFDYAAIRIKHEDAAQQAAIIKKIGNNPIQVFSNKRGDKVLIFQLLVKRNL